MKCEFVPGQRVVCAAQGPWFNFSGTAPSNAPTRHKTYVIADLGPVYADGEIYLELEAIPGLWWHHAGFEAIPPKETSIDVFTKAPTTPADAPRVKEDA